MGNGQSVPGSGSGYFIRVERKLFFITAKHVFLGCDPKDTCQRPVKRAVFPETMDIKLTTDGIINQNIIPISIKKFRDTAICPWTDPDIVAYQVINTPTDTVYSIEQFLNKKVPDKKGVISIYGYPSATYILPSGLFEEQNSSQILLEKSTFYDNYRYKSCGGGYTIDRQDYIVQLQDTVRDNLHGYSGSPSFMFDIEKQEWLFIGTFTNIVEFDKFLFVKPDYTLSATKNAIY